MHLTVAAHFDFNDNIACVAHGRRRFMLFPPEQLENLYVGPLEFTPQGVPISLVDVHNPDLARYPRFERAVAAAQVAELEAGDAIFIPYMWWHSVRSLEPFNISDQLLVERRAPTRDRAVPQPAAWGDCHREPAELTAGHVEEILRSLRLSNSRRSGRAYGPRAARAARQSLAGTSGTVHRGVGASTERSTMIFRS